MIYAVPIRHGVHSIILTVRACRIAEHLSKEATLSKWKERPNCLPPRFCETTTSRALSLQVITCCTPLATSSLLRGLHAKTLLSAQTIKT